MTNPHWRILGDDVELEAFIPCGGPRSEKLLLEVARRMRGEWTPEERAEMQRRQAEDTAKRQAEWTRDLARHEALLMGSNHPTLRLVLDNHGPRPYPPEGQPRGYECHACPGGFDEDGEIVHPEWPCPTWKLIEREEA